MSETPFPEGIDLVAYINLNSRIDRRQEMEAELARVGVPKSKILRWEATRMPKNGALGCITSHAALQEHIATLPDNIQTILIFEDDFSFIEDTALVNKSLEKFTSYPKDSWDLVLLSYYVWEHEHYDDLVSRTFRAQHASGYMINRRSLPKILATFREGRDLLARTGKVQQYCADVYWWKLMKEGKTFFFNQFLGYQRYSYSNIEGWKGRTYSTVRK